MSEVRPAEKTAHGDNIPVHRLCVSGQLCGEGRGSDRKHNQLLHLYFDMLYTAPDVHCTAKGTDISYMLLVPQLIFGGGPFVVILLSVP